MDKVIYKVNRDTNPEEKSIKLNPILENFFVKLCLVGVSIFLFYNIYHSVTITAQKLEISRNARKEVNDLRMENLKMSMELEEMKSSEYLEIQARDRLDLSASDEYVFIIDPVLLKDAESVISSYINDSEQKETRQVYQVWMDFFEDGI
ncbi:MAG TPA: septum formation initiator family protein [Candidatus Dojkabacteria bacterium]|nr:septum formation initiator family protein [Candidatus Dojkabacteria bacterium]